MAHLSIKRWTKPERARWKCRRQRNKRKMKQRHWVLRFSWEGLDDCTHVLPQSNSLLRLSEYRNLLPLFVEQQTAFSTHPFCLNIAQSAAPWSLKAQHFSSSNSHWDESPEMDRVCFIEQLQTNTSKYIFWSYLRANCFLRSWKGFSDIDNISMIGQNRSGGKNVVFIYLFIYFGRSFWLVYSQPQNIKKKRKQSKLIKIRFNDVLGGKSMCGVNERTERESCKNRFWDQHGLTCWSQVKSLSQDCGFWSTGDGWPMSVPVSVHVQVDILWVWNFRSGAKISNLKCFYQDTFSTFSPFHE